MLLRTCFLALSFAVLSFFAAPAVAGSWILSSESDFPPYNYYENAQFTGIDKEIVQLVLADLGHQPFFVQLPWKRVIQSVERNEVDLGFQFVGTPERFEKFHMVGPIRNGITTFMFLADSGINYQRLEDLRGHMIGTVRGYAYSAEFDAADYLLKEPETDNETNVRKLALGRVHAIVGDRHTLAFLAKRQGLSGRFKFADVPLAVVPRYVAFPKQREAQARAFQEALDRKIDEGAVDMIIAAFTGVEVSQNVYQAKQPGHQTTQ